MDGVKGWKRAKWSIIMVEMVGAWWKGWRARDSDGARPNCTERKLWTTEWEGSFNWGENCSLGQAAWGKGKLGYEGIEVGRGWGFGVQGERMPCCLRWEGFSAGAKSHLTMQARIDPRWRCTAFLADLVQRIIWLSTQADVQIRGMALFVVGLMFHRD